MIEYVAWLQGLSGLIKVMLTGAVALICGGFLVLLWQEPRTTPTAGKPAQATPLSGPVIHQNVTSHGQSGGITAHKVNSDVARK